MKEGDLVQTIVDVVPAPTFTGPGFIPKGTLGIILRAIDVTSTNPKFHIVELLIGNDVLRISKTQVRHLSGI